MADDLFENEDEDEEFERIIAHGQAIHQLVDDYAEEHDLPVDTVWRLMFDIAVKQCMIAYCLETAKPSGSGLKAELDRCRRDLDGLFREHKKGADDFVRLTKEAIDRAEREEDEPPEDT